MIKIQDKPTVYFDVDDTLVMWSPHDVPEELHDDYLILNDGGKHNVTVYPHRKHVEVIKQFKARGHNVVVWSQGGSDWAETVVKALGLEELIDLVVTKPNWFADDLPSTAFMPEANRIWISLKGDRKPRVMEPKNHRNPESDPKE